MKKKRKERALGFILILLVLLTALFTLSGCQEKNRPEWHSASFEIETVRQDKDSLYHVTYYGNTCQNVFAISYFEAKVIRSNAYTRPILVSYERQCGTFCNEYKWELWLPRSYLIASY